MRDEDPHDIALRTYHFLRLGMLAVIVGLAVSIAVEWLEASGCWQPSISAYYYTPSRSIFVGGLVALGLAMVAMWGRNPAEDAFLNLAGLFAPVVAFVPTAEANYCGVVAVGADGGPIDATTTSAEEEASAEPVVDAAQAAIDNNIGTLLAVVAIGLVVLAVRHRRAGAAAPALTTPAGWPYAVSFTLAVIAWVVGLVTFTWWSQDFYDKAHFTSAVALFACIIVVVLANAYENTVGDRPHEPPRLFLRRLPRRLLGSLRDRYGILALVMIGSAILIIGVGVATGWDHWVLVVEAVLIALFFLFWVMQTFDRGDAGPQRRTDVGATTPATPATSSGQTRATGSRGSVG